MQIDPWILAFSAFTVVVTIWMGFWSAKKSKTASDFFVAGRSVSVGWNASAISGEYLSAASFMGVAGMVMSSGYDALWYPVCYACGYLFLLLFIAGPLRRFGAYTIPDFAEGRFDSPLFRKIAVSFVLFIGFFYTMPQMKGAGTTLSYIFQDLDFRGTALAFLAPHEKGEAIKGLHYGVGVFLVGAVITLNVALGGMKGITLVQAFQYWAKMFAISVPIFVLMAVYGNYGKQVEMNEQPHAPSVPAGTEFKKVRERRAQEKAIDEWRLRAAAALPAETLANVDNRKIVALGLSDTLGFDKAFQQSSVLGLCQLYGMIKGKNVFLAGTKDDSSDVMQPVPLGHTRTVLGTAALRVTVVALANAGFVLVSEDEDEVRFARTNLLSSAPRPPAMETFQNKLGGQTNTAPFPRIGSLVRVEYNGASAPESGSFRGSILPAALLLSVWSDRRPVLVHTNLAWRYGAPEIEFAYAGRGDTRHQLAEGVRRSYGAIIIDAGEALAILPETIPTNAFVFAPLNRSGRKSLPAKAPTDATWLNPFGPLTTKAVAAANASPRWNFSGENRAHMVDFIGRPPPGRIESMIDSAEEFVDNIGSRKSTKLRGSQFADWTNMPPNATRSIGGGFPMLSTLREFGLLLERPVWVATNLPRPLLPLKGSFQNRDQFLNYLEHLFLTNGVHLDLSGHAIKAVAETNWDQYVKNPASIELVPNRIYSMRLGPHEEKLPDGTVVVRHVEPKILMHEYGELLGKRALMSVNLPTNGIDFNPTFAVMLAHEAKAGMEASLKASGISIVPGAKEVWAVPTTELSRYLLKPIDPRPYSLLYTYSLIIALVCGTAGLPHILVRFYTNPDGVAAKRTTMWVMILIGVFYLFPPVFGVMGRNLMPDLYNGLAGVKGTDGIVLKLPKLLNDRFGMLGSVLSGVTCAGAFAAFMSTFSGLLVSMTSALAHDVYGRILRPKSTPDERMKMFKLCAVIVGAGAMLLGFLVESFEINKMVGWAFAIAATSYFPLLFLSTWWRGITMRGAATGMLVGGTLSLLAIASTMFADQAAWAAGLKAWYAVHPLWRILAEQPAIWGLPLALGLMYVISKRTAHDIPPDIRMKMLVLHAPEKLGLKQEYIQEHQVGH